MWHATGTWAVHVTFAKQNCEPSYGPTLAPEPQKRLTQAPKNANLKTLLPKADSPANTSPSFALVMGTIDYSWRFPNQHVLPLADQAAVAGD